MGRTFALQKGYHADEEAAIENERKSLSERHGGAAARHQSATKVGIVPTTNWCRFKNVFTPLNFEICTT